MRQRVPLVDGHRVRNAVPGVEHDSRGAARGVQREHGLDGDVPILFFCFFRNRGSEKEVSASFFPSPFSPPPPLSFFPSLDLFQNSHRGHVEGLEHDLRHLLAVGLGVERRLGQQDRVLLGRDAELVVEGVVPDLLLLFDCFFFLREEGRRKATKGERTKKRRKKRGVRNENGNKNENATSKKRALNSKLSLSSPLTMSSQLVTIPCSIGYLSVRIPRLDCASSPT